MPQRCAWCGSDPLYVRYHDEEWGMPVHDDRRLLDLTATHGSLDAYLWQFVDGRPIVNQWDSLQQIPTRTAQSDAMSKGLQRAGATFVGTTICHAFMQAVGMVDDHVATCWRRTGQAPPT